MRAVFPPSLTVLALLGLGAVAPGARAATATYTNAADFNAAVLARGYQMDTIVPGGMVTYLSNGLSIDGVSFVNSDYGMFSGEVPVGFYTGPDPAGQGSLVGGLGLSPLEIGLPANTLALGYDVKDETQGGGYTFFGEVSDTPLSTRTLMAQGGSSDYLLLHNVAFAPVSPPAVPETGTLSLTGLGLGVLLWTVRRRRQG